jgi:hypothetical protein
MFYALIGLLVLAVYVASEYRAHTRDLQDTIWTLLEERRELVLQVARLAGRPLPPRDLFDDSEPEPQTEEEPEFDPDLWIEP